MRSIAILLGSAAISGGTNVIIEHATRLQAMQFEVTILTLQPVQPQEYGWHPDAQKLHWTTINEVKESNFHFCIATWWQSVWLLDQVRAEHYLYFIQSIESRFFPERDPDDFSLRDIDILTEWCESTYRYPLPVITEAKWIRTYLQQQYHHQPFLVPNGIRKDIYTESGSVVQPRQAGRLRVLVEGPLGVFYKNVEKTIALCQKAKVDELWLLTSSDIDNYPGVDRCFSRVPVAKTAEIYRSCDILVKLSTVEGMFGPPLEIFHCGGTAIVYDVTGHDEYIIDGKNGIVVAEGSDELVVEHLIRLKNDTEYLEQLKTAALETARIWPDWHSSAGQFAAALEAIGNLPPCGRELIGAYSNYYLTARENSSGARALNRFSERETTYGTKGEAGSNYLQVYWDEGQGLTEELVAQYASGSWQECKVTIPVTNRSVTVRLDPSVLIGVVRIKKILLIEKGTERRLLELNESTGWDGVYLGGTLVCLGKDRLLTLLSTGEDPQCILPGIEDYSGEEGIELLVQLCELPFSQALNGFTEEGGKGLKKKRGSLSRYFKFLQH